MTIYTPPSSNDQPIPSEPTQEHHAPLAVTAPVDIRNVGLSVLTALGALFLLRYAQSLFVPIVLSILCAYILDPFVTLVGRFHIPRPIAAGLLMLALLTSGGYGAYTLRHQAATVIDSLPEAAAKMRRKIEQARRSSEAPSPLTKIRQAAKELEQTAAAADADKGSTPRPQTVQVQQPAFRATDYLWAGSLGAIELMTQFLSILFLVFFLLASGDLFKRKFVRIIGTRFSEKRVTFDALNEINAQIERFLLVQVGTGVIVGVCTAAALWVFGLNQPMIWGIAAGLLNAVPYVGVIVTVAGLALATFLQFDSAAMTLQTVGIALLIHSLVAFFLTPWLMSRVSRINGAAMFLSILFWSWLWGAIGMLVAVPITMVIKTICERIEGLEAIGDLLDPD